MLYRDLNFHPVYLRRKATAEEVALQKKAARRRKLAILLDSWVRKHEDTEYNESSGMTGDFVGWAVLAKNGGILAVVQDAHAFIDALKNSPTERDKKSS